MSFGIGIGDVIKLVEITTKVYYKWSTAPDEYQALKSELKSFSLYLQSVETSVPLQRGLKQASPEEREGWSHAIQRALSVLARLGELVRRAQPRDRKLLRWLPMAKTNAEPLRRELERSKQAIQAFHAVLMQETQDGLLLGLQDTHVDMLAVLHNIARRQRAGNDSRLSTWTVHGDEDPDVAKALFRELRRDFIMAGFGNDQIRQFRALLVSSIRSMVESGQFEEASPSERYQCRTSI
jgi:hypothetical protein